MRYLRWYLARSFHSVLVTGSLEGFQDDGTTPLIVVLNHSSWWDVLLGMYVESTFFGWERYGVMDERQLLRYRFFANLGMIGVDRTSLSGAREFAAYAHDLLNGKRRSLWLTPQGAMVSNYARPIRFQSGLGHIAASLDRFYFTSVAIHYEYWSERLPEAFVSLSPVQLFSLENSSQRREWLVIQQSRLETQLDSLLDLVRARNSGLFRPLLRGSSGVNRVYDTVRALSARLSGEGFSADHGDVASPAWHPPED